MFPVQNIYIKIVKHLYYFQVSAFGQLYYTRMSKILSCICTNKYIFFSAYFVVYIVSLCLKFFTKYYKDNIKFLIALYVLSYAVNSFFIFINCYKFIILMDIKFKSFCSMERHHSVEIKISIFTLLQNKDHSKLFLLFAAFSSYFKNKAMTNVVEFKEDIYIRYCSMIV